MENNNKKPSEPLYTEGWEREHGKLILLINQVEDTLNERIDEKFLVSLLLSGASLAISILILLRL